MEEFFKLREENKKLEDGLRSCDEKIKTLVSDKADLTEKVTNFEAKAWIAEEYLKEAELARDDEIARAIEEVWVKFKHSEEFSVLLKEKYDAGHDAGYDVCVEEIFYNIWVKRQDVDYRFLGGELVKLMDQWLEEERMGTLNTTPPPSALVPVTEGNVVAAEVGPSEVPEQQPPVDVEEGEVVASNPPPIVEEPAN